MPKSLSERVREATETGVLHVSQAEWDMMQSQLDAQEAMIAADHPLLPARTLTGERGVFLGIDVIVDEE